MKSSAHHFILAERRLISVQGFQMGQLEMQLVGAWRTGFETRQRAANRFCIYIKISGF
jgi:hypothetical protein